MVSEFSLEEISVGYDDIVESEGATILVKEV